jgi:hypothetical protein
MSVVRLQLVAKRLGLLLVCDHLGQQLKEAIRSDCCSAGYQCLTVSFGFSPRSLDRRRLLATRGPIRFQAAVTATSGNIAQSIPINLTVQ